MTDSFDRRSDHPSDVVPLADRLRIEATAGELRTRDAVRLRRWQRRLTWAILGWGVALATIAVIAIWPAGPVALWAGATPTAAIAILSVGIALPIATGGTLLSALAMRGCDRRLATGLAVGVGVSMIVLTPLQPLPTVVAAVVWLLAVRTLQAARRQAASGEPTDVDVRNGTDR